MKRTIISLLMVLILMLSLAACGASTSQESGSAYDKNAANGGILVLHRIWKVSPEGIYLVGDNQKEIEGPLRPDQMRGVMAGMNRKGKFIPATNAVYRVLTGIWLWLRPFRPVISKTAAFFKRLVCKK